MSKSLTSTVKSSKKQFLHVFTNGEAVYSAQSSETAYPNVKKTKKWYIHNYPYMGVSKHNGTPKSSILIGVSTIFTIHFGVPLFLETREYTAKWMTLVP